MHGHRLADGHDRLHHHPHQRLQALPRPLCEFISNLLPFFSDQQTPDIIFLQPTPFNNMNHENVFKALWLLAALGNILFFVARGNQPVY